jgi:putative transposase
MFHYPKAEDLQETEAKILAFPHQVRNIGWRWSSLWRRIHGDDQPRQFLSSWPLPMPEGWIEHVNVPQTETELEALRRSVQRGCPYGSAGWQKQMAARLGLGHTLRPLGRPKKVPETEEPATLS